MLFIFILKKKQQKQLLHIYDKLPMCCHEYYNRCKLSSNFMCLL